MEVIIICPHYMELHLQKAIINMEKMGHAVVVVEQKSIPVGTITIERHELPIIDLKVAVEQKPYKPGVASWHNPSQKKFRKGAGKRR